MASMALCKMVANQTVTCSILACELALAVHLCLTHPAQIAAAAKRAELCMHGRAHLNLLLQRLNLVIKVTYEQQVAPEVGG
jgi:hypothetical protein